MNEIDVHACVALVLSEPFDETLGAWSESHFASVWRELRTCAAEYDRLLGGDCGWGVGWCHPGHWDHVRGLRWDNPLSFVGLVSSLTEQDARVLRRETALPAHVALGVSFRTRRLAAQPVSARELCDYVRYVALDEPADSWFGLGSDTGEWLELARAASAVAGGELSEFELQVRLAGSRDRWTVEGYQVVHEAVARIAGLPA